MRRADLLLVWSAMSLAACAPRAEDQAAALVRKYDARLAEAYRSADPRIVEEVAGDREASKITGLIGVKYDSGLTLDAQLLSLEVLGVSRKGDRIDVRTDERWHYVDRQVGTGAQVGEASDDRYRLVYHLEKKDQRWVVGEVELDGPPVIGRRTAPLGDSSAQHGVTKVPPADGGTP
ncbi:MAG TPA: hypothetical protein VFE30_02065 [Anaeromyxobacteraceae bacterium]|jgi:hypothetical protein|nr:hypothetical protein [Anaeromyxobacteraceae bacterium]